MTPGEAILSAIGGGNKEERVANVLDALSREGWALVHTAQIGNAGAGPVGEAVAFDWESRDDLHRVRAKAWRLWCDDQPSTGWSEENRDCYMIRAALLLARPVEPGEVERLTRENNRLTDAAVDAEAALAESEQIAQGLASDLAGTQAELDEMRAALVQIEGGHFPGAADVAISGSWQVAVNQLQGIARAALTGDAQEGGK